MHETLIQESLRCSVLTVTLQMYETRREEEIRCVYCGSTTVDFQDYVQIEKRLNDKKLSVKESWVCIRCGKEFEHLGTLHSPLDLNRIKLRSSILAWCGYTVGSLLGYSFILAT